MAKPISCKSCMERWYADKPVTCNKCGSADIASYGVVYSNDTMKRCISCGTSLVQCSCGSWDAGFDNGGNWLCNKCKAPVAQHYSSKTGNWDAMVYGVKAYSVLNPKVEFDGVSKIPNCGWVCMCGGTNSMKHNNCVCGKSREENKLKPTCPKCGSNRTETQASHKNVRCIACGKVWPKTGPACEQVPLTQYEAAILKTAQEKHLRALVHNAKNGAKLYKAEWVVQMEIYRKLYKAVQGCELDDTYWTIDEGLFEENKLVVDTTQAKLLGVLSKVMADLADECMNDQRFEQVMMKLDVFNKCLYEGSQKIAMANYKVVSKNA